MLTAGQPVLITPGRVTTGVPIPISHRYDSIRKKSRRRRESNPGSAALEVDALTTGPTRRRTEENQGYRRKTWDAGGSFDNPCSGSAAHERLARNVPHISPCIHVGVNKGDVAQLQCFAVCRPTIPTAV